MTTPALPLSLDVQGVGVKAGATQILDGIHLRLYGGELCALIGPSGAGKSTLIKVLLGLRSPSAGRVTLGGHAPDSGHRPVGYVPQDDALHTTLTVHSCLQYAADLRLPHLDDAGRNAKLDEVIRAVGLEERLDLVIKKLSGGQRKRVSVALELLTEPDLLILDEPTSGLDPGLEARMMHLFADVAAQGRVVLVATHAMESIEKCQALVVLVRGQVAYAGRPQDALPFFRTDTYAGLFHQLDKQPPSAWARANAQYAPSQQFRTRTGPARPASPQPLTTSPAPSVVTQSTPTPPTLPAAEPTGDDALAALKKQMGVKS